MMRTKESVTSVFCGYVGDGECDRDRHDIIIRGCHMIFESGHMTYDGSSHDVSGWLCHTTAHMTWPNDEKGVAY